MKANFKIENDDSDKNKDDESIKKIEDKEFYYLVEKRDKNIIETNLEN